MCNRFNMRGACWKPVLVFSVMVGLGANAARGQGWGMVSPKTTMITRLLPPTVNLRGKAVRVEASIAGNFPEGQALDAGLKARLVAQIQTDPRIIISETNPQTILRFTITNFYLETYNVQTATGPFGTGTKTSTPKYRGKMEVAYQAVAADSGRPLDSANLKEVAGYDIEKDGGGLTNPFRRNRPQEAAAGSPHECKDQLINGINEQMAMRIAAVGTPVQVKLPGGKLDQVSALAIAGRWGDVQEKAENMDKLPKPGDDAFRVYMVALAKEAQAYKLTSEANDSYTGKRSDITPAMAAADISKAQKLMDEAGTSYKEALQASSKDTNFLAGDTRAEEAIAIYATIERYKKENELANQPHPVPAPGPSMPQPSGAATPAGGGAGVTARRTPLDDVLDMCRHDIDADSVKDYIQSSEFLDLAKKSDYKFSFVPDSVRLKEACKANAPLYQKLIRARLSPPAKTGGK